MDKNSRLFNDRMEWALLQDAFEQLCARWGCPEIDLFTSYLNTKLKQFVAWGPDPYSDAFMLNWASIYRFCFPPFSLWMCILQKLALEGGCLLVVAPNWTSQPWFTEFTRLSTTEHITISHKHRLYLPWEPQRPHPLQPQLCLVATVLHAMPAQ